MLKLLGVLALSVCLSLVGPSIVLAHGHHYGGHYGPVIIVAPPIYVPYPIPAPVCIEQPGRWVWTGSGWVWVPGQMVCS